jgi:hypothetical protein
MYFDLKPINRYDESIKGDFMRKLMIIMLVFLLGACGSVRQYRTLKDKNIDTTQTLFLNEYLPLWSSLYKEPISRIKGETQITEILEIINTADFVKEGYVTPATSSNPFTYTLVLPLSGGQESMFIYILVNSKGIFVTDMSQQVLHSKEVISTIYKIHSDQEETFLQRLEIK